MKGRAGIKAAGKGNADLLANRQRLKNRRHGRNSIPPEYHLSVHKSRPTHNTRARERARQERQQMKQERRAQTKARKANEPAAAGDEDPDIAGIVPGPQANPWGDEPEIDAEDQ